MKIIPFNKLDTVAAATLPFLKSGRVAISGGSTYTKLFTEWAKYDAKIDADFFPVDERMVPMSDPESNWGAAKRLLFDPLGLTRQERHFTQNVEQYEKLLEDSFGTSIPEFDVIFLGIGDDGHTASLFPNGDYLDNCEAVVLQTVAPKAPHDRITLGPSVIRKSKKLVSILWGDGKKEIAQRILSGDDSLPFVKVTKDHPDHVLFCGTKLM